MKDLQAIINKRAEDKLNEKIKLIRNFLFETHYNFLESAGNVYFKNAQGEYKEVPLRGIINEHTGIIPKLKEHHLPKFIEAETNLFLAEIEQLKERVSQLGEDVDNILPQLS